MKQFFNNIWYDWCILDRSYKMSIILIPLLSVLTILLVMSGSSMFVTLENNYRFNYRIMHDDKLKDKVTPEIVCLIYDCKYIVKIKDGEIYYYGLGIIKGADHNSIEYGVDQNFDHVLLTRVSKERISLASIFDTKFREPEIIDMIVKYFVIVDENAQDGSIQFLFDWITSVIPMIESAIVIIFIFYVTLVLFLWRVYVNNIKAKIKVKSDALIKNTLKKQVEITESLHHEFSAPIKGLSIIIEDIYTTFFGCLNTDCKYKSKDYGICPVVLGVMNGKEIREDLVPDCPWRKIQLDDLDEGHRLLIDSYKNFHITLERLTYILKLLRAGKEIKHRGTEEGFSITDTVNVAADSAVMFAVNKVTVKYENKYKYENIVTDSVLHSGLICNAINCLITNASEASASHIVITFKLSNLKTDNTYFSQEKAIKDDEDEGYYFFSIIVKDDGHGIRNADNEIETNMDNIFKLGYSTKDPIIIKQIKDKKEEYLNSVRYKITKFFDRLFKTSISEKRVTQITADVRSNRGIGLAMSKKELRAIGSDINVISTSSKGSVFRIDLRITKKNIINDNA